MKKYDTTNIEKNLNDLEKILSEKSEHMNKEDIGTLKEHIKKERDLIKRYKNS